MIARSREKLFIGSKPPLKIGTQTDTKDSAHYLGLLDTKVGESTREPGLLPRLIDFGSMSIVAFQRCVSTEPWQVIPVSSSTDVSKIYRVVAPWPDDDVDDLVCECQSYLYRGHCRHQQEAFESLCRWSALDGSENQTREERKAHVCPRCGGDTIGDAEFE